MAYYLSHGRNPVVAHGQARETKAEENPLNWVRSFAVFLAVAAVVAVILNFLSVYQRQKAKRPVAEETGPKVTFIAARPSAAPTPTPAVSSLRLYAFGGELGADGFTTYVEDRAIEISAELEPKLSRPPIYWSVSDDKAASLTVSDDRMSCKFLAVKPAGKIELTVSCYGMETVIPVYLWER